VLTDVQKNYLISVREIIQIMTKKDKHEEINHLIVDLRINSKSQFFIECLFVDIVMAVAKICLTCNKYNNITLPFGQFQWQCFAFFARIVTRVSSYL
jgi:hypothetical protein